MQLLSDASKAPENKELAEAAASAKAAIERVQQDYARAQQAAAAKEEAAKAAGVKVVDAETALSKEKSDDAGAAGRIESMQQSVAQAAAESLKVRSSVEEASKTLAPLKANVDQLERDYQRMTQEAGVPAPGGAGKT